MCKMVAMSPDKSYENDPLERLALVVHEAREARGWTMAHAASRGDCDRRTWSAVERGAPATETTYRRIARAFGVHARLVLDAVRDVEHADTLVESLTLAREPDNEPDNEPAAADDDALVASLDPAELADARLLLVLRSLVDELENRLSGRTEAMQALLRTGRRRPGTGDVIERLSKSLNDNK